MDFNLSVHTSWLTFTVQPKSDGGIQDLAGDVPGPEAFVGVSS